MSTTIIKANPDFIKKLERKGEEVIDYLFISEFFCDTIQGEGISVGQPSAFLRLQGCTLNCKWCDTKDIYKQGNPYSFDEIFKLMQDANLINKLQEGQHLIITGGSPLMQQNKLIKFVDEFIYRYQFRPFIEVENECTILPELTFSQFVDQWNNSPKLGNSGVRKNLRYKINIHQRFSFFESKTWYKFVISNEEDWKEIKQDYIDEPKIRLNRNRIILMPQGSIREELDKNREKVIEIACRENVRYSDRLHIVTWNNKKGV